MLLTSNPKNAVESLGFAIDMAIIKNTEKRNNGLNKRRIAKLLNSFTLCERIEITYDGVSYSFLFRNEQETLTSLYQILGWVIGEGDESQEMYVETFLKNGFLCHDENGYEVSMKFYD